MLIIAGHLVDDNRRRLGKLLLDIQLVIVVDYGNYCWTFIGRRLGKLLQDIQSATINVDGDDRRRLGELLLIFSQLTRRLGKLLLDIQTSSMGYHVQSVLVMGKLLSDDDTVSTGNPQITTWTMLYVGGASAAGWCGIVVYWNTRYLQRAVLEINLL